MRKTLLTISLLALLVAACGTSQPGKPSPTVLGTQAPAPTIEATAQPTEAPAKATNVPAPAPTAPPMPVSTPPPTPHY